MLEIQPHHTPFQICRSAWLNAMRKIGILLVFTGLVFSMSLGVIGKSMAQTKENVIFIGARSDTRPMSYLDKNGKFAGYTIDICNRIKAKYNELFPNKKRSFQYKEVTATKRFPLLKSGKISAICGATTVTAKRMKDADFSFFIFASGASVATRKEAIALLSSPTKDKMLKRVAVVSETTTKSAVEHLLGTTVNLKTYSTHTKAYNALRDKSADYYFADRVIIEALVATASRKDKIIVGGSFLTYEPYAIAISKNYPEFLHAANITIAELYRSNGIKQIYHAHFGNRKPGKALQSIYSLFAIPK